MHVYLGVLLENKNVSASHMFIYELNKNMYVLTHVIYNNFYTRYNL